MVRIPDHVLAQLGLVNAVGVGVEKRLTFEVSERFAGVAATVGVEIDERLGAAYSRNDLDYVLRILRTQRTKGRLGNACVVGESLTLDNTAPGSDKESDRRPRRYGLTAIVADQSNDVVGNIDDAATGLIEHLELDL